MADSDGGDGCFERLGPRESFLMLGPEGLSEWLGSWGFGGYGEVARSFGGFGLTGMVLSFLTDSRGSPT